MTATIHSFNINLLAPIMCEKLYWVLEYGTDKTLDLPNEVYTEDGQKLCKTGQKTVSKNFDM